MIMILPIRLLRELQVDRRQKIGLAGIFGVGVIIMAAAIVRCTQIVAYARSDPVGLAVWSLVESSISVMVGALPALKTLLTRTILRTLNRSNDQTETSLQQSDVPIGRGRSTPRIKSRNTSSGIPLHRLSQSESQEHIAKKSAGVYMVDEMEYN